MRNDPPFADTTDEVMRALGQQLRVSEMRGRVRLQMKTNRDPFGAERLPHQVLINAEDARELAYLLLGTAREAEAKRAEEARRAANPPVLTNKPPF